MPIRPDLLMLSILGFSLFNFLFFTAFQPRTGRMFELHFAVEIVFVSFLAVSTAALFLFMIRRRRELDRLQNSESGEVIVRTDRRGWILGSSRSFSDRLGYGERELNDRSFEELIVQADLGDCRNFFRNLKTFQSMPFFCTVGLRSKNGETVDFELLGINLISNPFVAAIILRCRDVTRQKNIETEIRALREDQERLLDSLPAFVFIKDREGRYQWVNRTFADLVARPKGEIIGRLTADVLSGKEAIRQAVDEQEVLATEIPKTEILESIIAPSGTVWLKLDIRPFRDGQGRVTGTFGFGFDVSRLKETQEQLLDSENKYESIFRENPAVMLIVDPGTGKIREANHAAMAFYGFPSERLLGMFLTDLSMRRPTEVLADLARAERNYSAIYRSIHRISSGEEREIEVYAGPVEIHRQILIFMVVQDITGRGRVERLLRESESRFRMLFNESADGLALVSPRGRFLDFNNTYLRLTGYNEDELSRLLPTDLFAEEQAPAIGPETIAERFQKALAGSVEKIVIRHRRKDGAVFDGEVTMSRVHLGQEIGVQVSLRDLTERNLMQTELIHAERWAAVGHLAAGIAHEFNNIMTIIKGNAELLLEEPGAAGTAKEMMQTIIRQVQRGSNLVANVRSYSQRNPPRKELFYLSEIVETVLERQADALAEGKIAVGRDFQVSGYVNADRQGMRQVFENLLSNAIHAIRPKGGGRITVSLAEEAGMVVLSVADDGIGIGGERRNEIFTPFYSTKGAYTTGADRLPGTGLGLAVAYSLVKQHNGSITFDSRPGEGSVFRLRIPAVGPPDKGEQ